ncbi:NAD(P)-binding protein [Mucilaginibacter paludis]
MAGLCASCYLGMNDYQVTIYEMNSTPGGEGHHGSRTLYRRPIRTMVAG